MVKMSNVQQKEIYKGAALNRLWHTYRPYWYLFLLLFLIVGCLAFLYIKTSIPLYESFASVLIKDEKRGQEDSKMEEVLNVFSQKNIVENEVEVLKSNAILREVVGNLKLNAPIWEEVGWGGQLRQSAFHSSPVIVEVKDSIVYKNSQKIYFEPLDDQNILYNRQKIKIGEWVKMPEAEIRFIPNPQYWKGFQQEGSHFYVQLLANEKAADILASRLMISPTSKQASVVFMKLKDEVPDRGEAILSEIIQSYARASARKKNETAHNTLRFIENRLDKVTAELDSVERGIEQYRNASGIVDISEQSNQYLRSMEQNDLELNKMKMQLAVIDEVEHYVRSTDQSLMAPSITSITDPTLAQMLDRLYVKEQEREKLKRTTAENNPILTSLDGEINRIKSGITENVSNQRKNIEAGRSYLSTVSGKYNSMLNAIPKKEKELVEVSRQRNIKADIYSFLLQKKEEAMYALKSAVPEVQVVELPASGNKPVSPKIPFIVALSLVLPIVMGMGLISAREYMNGKILYRSDIESLTHLPVMAEIGYDPDEANVLEKAGTRSFVQEQFRQLRSAYRHLRSKELCRDKVMVTSSIEGDGKSFVAANFAISLARSGKKVVIVGLDLYQPKVHELFQVELGVGMSDWLQGNKEYRDVIQATSIAGLSLVTAGSYLATPNEWLSGSRLKSCLDILAEQFDVVVIDTPPTRPVSDAFEIAQWCNLVLFVVRHDHTPKNVLQVLDRELHQHQIDQVQIIFNGVKRRGVGRFSYGYGYGYGYDDRMSYVSYGKKKKRVVA